MSWSLTFKFRVDQYENVNVRNAYNHTGDAAPSGGQRTAVQEEAVIQYSVAWRGVAFA